MSNNLIFQIKLKKENLNFEGAIMNEGSEEQTDMVSLPFHNGAINGMDICIRKPLIATCGVDKTIKIWNYEEKTLEFS